MMMSNKSRSSATAKGTAVASHASRISARASISSPVSRCALPQAAERRARTITGGSGRWDRESKLRITAEYLAGVHGINAGNYTKKNREQNLEFCSVSSRESEDDLYDLS
jgi:hypothetical protein